MKKRTELDERQLWQRGNVFKHAFVFLIAALALEALCKAFGVTWAQGPWEAILLIWGSVALCWWEFILRDINPNLWGGHHAHRLPDGQHPGGVPGKELPGKAPPCWGRGLNLQPEVPPPAKIPSHPRQNLL